MFSSITAPRMSPVRGGPLFYTYVHRTASAAPRRQASDPICRGCHDPRCVTHEYTHRSRQLVSSSCLGCCAVSNLIRPHYVQYGTAAFITRRQTRQMFIEMAFNLTFRLHHKPQACSVTRCSGEGAD